MSKNNCVYNFSSHYSCCHDYCCVIVKFYKSSSNLRSLESYLSRAVEFQPQTMQQRCLSHSLKIRTKDFCCMNIWGTGLSRTSSSSHSKWEVTWKWCFGLFLPEHVDHAWNYHPAFNWRLHSPLHCAKRGQQLVPDSEETVMASADSCLSICVDLPLRWNGVIVLFMCPPGFCEAHL